MNEAERLRKEARELESMARLVSFALDKARLLKSADDLRRRADEWEARHGGGSDPQDLSREGGEP